MACPWNIGYKESLTERICTRSVHRWKSFSADSMALSSQAPVKGIYGKMVRYGRSGSFKVIEIGTTRDPYATSYEPSIVTICLLSFPRYNDIFVENLCFFAFLPKPVSFKPLQGVSVGPRVRKFKLVSIAKLISGVPVGEACVVTW